MEAASLPLPPKPRLRGVLHKYAFYAWVVLGAALVIVAPAGEGRIAAAVYVASVAALFGISALYHLCEWPTEAARRWMRRLDHTTIFVAIAGTYTPFMLLALDGPLATGILIVVWAGAIGGALMKLLWIDAPGWLSAMVYVALGWVMIVAFPSLFEALGATPFAMLTGAGVIYTLGAFVWAFGRPDPVPEVFGYHEVFHALTIAGVALQYAAIAFFVVPGAG
jgi:hemolysin III